MVRYRARVATWNLNNRGPAVAHNMGALLKRFDIDLLLAQELNLASSETLVQSAGMTWIRTAFDGGAPVPPSGSGRRRVTAIAGRSAPPERVGVPGQLPLPERMVYALIATPVGQLMLASYHAPPGVSWGQVKVQHAHSLLEWVNATPAPLVVGADANTPEVDHPDRDRVRTHWHTGRRRLGGQTGDDDMFGGRPRHRLDDAYRRWVEAHPEELAQIRAARPDGPLATSHRTGKRRDAPGFPRRFDALWIGPEMEISSINYHYEAAIAAGSDHALVVAELIWPASA
jgi:hypothetical protein